MVYATLSEFLLKSVVWFSGGALALMVLLLLEILRLRLRLIARGRRDQALIKKWQPVLAEAVGGGNPDLPALDKEDLLQFLKMWNHLHESRRGTARKHLNILALRLGIMPLLPRLLHGKDTGKKLLAITTIGNLQAHDEWDTLLKICRDPDALLSWTAAHALFQINANAALHDLEADLTDRLDWPAAHIIALLAEAGTDEMYTGLANRAVEFANTGGPQGLAKLYRLLGILRAAPYQHVLPAIHSILLQTTDDETLAQCIKFLREAPDLEHVRRHVAHLNWVVRLQVAHALGRFGLPEDIPRLVLLLSDPVWWVRYRAAQSLVTLTHGDTNTLTQLRTQLKDKFALDMLTMVSAEKEKE
ncbi:MAG TPA: HEAT repeat domain-containing protein [Gallionellaceae bacterium]|nr:HEAT repeat domain-containing protein [Gallionellaceae bacterium]